MLSIKFKAQGIVFFCLKLETHCSFYITRCVNYDEQYPDGWSIWLLLLTVVVVLLCGVVLFCLQCWLKSCGTDRPRRTMAVFAVGDLDPVYGAEMAGSPTAGICLPTQNTELCPAPSLGALGPPPPYEEILKTN